VGRNVELLRVTLDGKSKQLADTPAGSMHYHPQPSPDGKWLLYGSKRDGVRQLYVMRLSDKKEWRITDLAKGRAAMGPHWQPRAAPYCTDGCDAYQVAKLDEDWGAFHPQWRPKSGSPTCPSSAMRAPTGSLFLERVGHAVDVVQVGAVKGQAAA
jgi:hypothetical protein